MMTIPKTAMPRNTSRAGSRCGCGKSEVTFIPVRGWHIPKVTNLGDDTIYLYLKII